MSLHPPAKAWTYWANFLALCVRSEEHTSELQSH